jgi:hypothetical protein
MVTYRRSYVWQVPQLVAEHELQEEVPPIGADSPSLSLVKEAQAENTLLASL